MRFLQKYAWEFLFVIGLALLFYAYDNIFVIPALSPDDPARGWEWLTRDPEVISYIKWWFRFPVWFVIFDKRQIDRQRRDINRSYQTRQFDRRIGTGIVAGRRLRQLMQHRERLAPKSLAAEQPIAQFVINGCLCDPCGMQFGDDLLFAGLGGLASEFAGVD